MIRWLLFPSVEIFAFYWCTFGIFYLTKNIKFLKDSDIWHFDSFSYQWRPSLSTDALLQHFFLFNGEHEILNKFWNTTIWFFFVLVETFTLCHWTSSWHHLFILLFSLVTIILTIFFSYWFRDILIKDSYFDEGNSNVCHKDFNHFLFFVSRHVSRKSNVFQVMFDTNQFYLHLCETKSIKKIKL